MIMISIDNHKNNNNNNNNNEDNHSIHPRNDNAYHIDSNHCDVELHHKPTKTYRSQLSYGTYGDKICTPVGILVACRFLNSCRRLGDYTIAPAIADAHIMSTFSNKTIEDFMKVSASLYEERFPRAREPVQRGEILSIIMPTLKGNTAVVECAGLFSEEDLEEVKMDDGIISSFKNLISKHIMRDLQKNTCALVVTARNHTTTLLFDRSHHTIYFFDPLVACLNRCTERDILALFKKTFRKDEPFDAALLY